MDRRRLKNVIILILLLVNGFLLYALAARKSAEQASFRRTAEQLEALFEADGMTLDIYAISQDAPPAAVSLERDAALEEAAAAFLLGTEAVSMDQEGGVRRCQSESGEVLFRTSGSFEAAGRLRTEDAEDFCRQFCKTFFYGEPDFQLDENGTGTAAAVRLYEGLPVYNCAVSFTLDRGVLTAAGGVFLPETGTAAVSETPFLTAAGALTAFQQMRRENMAVASSVLDTQLCYEYQFSGSSLTLTPSWRIAADTADYYVNCDTGAVSAG